MNLIKPTWKDIVVPDEVTDFIDKSKDIFKKGQNIDIKIVALFFLKENIIGSELMLRHSYHGGICYAENVVRSMGVEYINGRNINFVKFSGDQHDLDSSVRKIFELKYLNENYFIDEIGGVTQLLKK